MAVAILAVNVRIIIDKILITCVVRGIYIDYVDYPCVSVCKGGEGFEVITLDKYMVGSIGAGIGQCAVFDLDENRKLVAQ